MELAEAVERDAGKLALLVALGEREHELRGVGQRRAVLGSGEHTDALQRLVERKVTERRIEADLERLGCAIGQQDVDIGALEVAARVVEADRQRAARHAANRDASAPGAVGGGGDLRPAFTARLSATIEVRTAVVARRLGADLDASERSSYLVAKRGPNLEPIRSGARFG
jgi:hypothetical protein